MKLGSLFDGIGGSLLSATMCGIEPVWASEIEPFPIKVTEYHFPNVKHLGDITKIKGDEIEPVDIIVGGSPCQDLSVAGKRAGMKHADFGDEEATRSGLFMEQIRIVKEMRNADKLRLERLSDTKIRGGSGTDNTSGKGGVCGDIRNTNAVSTDCGKGGTTTIESGITQHGLCGASQHIRPRYMVWENVPGAFSSNNGEDFRAVLEETARVADPTVSISRSVNGWANAGSILADGFSISWRTFDAQYWGVPQRRRRIYLVADFGGQSAPEILFESESMPGNITESRSKGQGVAADAEGGTGAAVAYGLVSKGNGEAFLMEEKHMSLSCGGGQAGQGYPAIVERRTDDAVCYGIDQQGGKGGANYTENVSPTILSDSHGTPHAVCYGIGGYNSEGMKSSNPHSGIYKADTSRTIDQNGGNPACNQGGIMVFEPRSQDGVPIVSQDGNCPTLNTAQGGQRQPCVVYESHPMDSRITGPHNISPTVTNHFHKGGADTPLVLDRASFNQGKNALYEPLIEQSEVCPTVISRGPCAVYSMQRSDEYVAADVTSTESARQYKSATDLVTHTNAVRRLTPLECERLQGYPDNYTNIPGASDSARYKALGNSFAIPNIYFVISKIKEVNND